MKMIIISHANYTHLTGCVPGLAFLAISELLSLFLKARVFHMKMIIISHANYTHLNGCVPGLALIERRKATRK